MDEEYGSTIWQVIRDAGEDRAIVIETAVHRYQAAVAEFARAAGHPEAEAAGLAGTVLERVFDTGRNPAASPHGTLRSVVYHEARAALAPRPTPSEGEFARAWLAALTGSSLLRLAERNPAEHSALRAFLGIDRPPAESSQALAAEDADRRAVVARARDRVARLLRDEIRATVSSEEEFRDEVRTLARLLDPAVRDP